MQWLRNQFDLANPGNKLRQRLTERIEPLINASKPKVVAHLPTETILGPNNLETVLGPSSPIQQCVERVCSALNKLHESLEHSNWSCTCRIRHQNAVFSFDYAHRAVEGHIPLSLAYLCPKDGKGPECWQGVCLSLRQSDSHAPRHGTEPSEGAKGDQTTTTLLKSIAATLGLTWFMQQSMDDDTDLCSHLTSIDEKRRTPDLDIMANAGQLSICGTQLTSPRSIRYQRQISLQDLFTHSVQGRIRLDHKQRLGLCLLLALGYLHLGDGPWWPFQCDMPQVCFFESDPTEGWSMGKPWLVSRRLQGNMPFPIPDNSKYLNHHTPSLAVLGKALLEIIVGRHFDWTIESIGAARAECHGMPSVLTAIDSCLGFEPLLRCNVDDGNDKSFRAKYEVQRLFTEHVVTKLEIAFSLEQGASLTEMLRPCTSATKDESRLLPSFCDLKPYFQRLWSRFLDSWALIIPRPLDIEHSPSHDSLLCLYGDSGRVESIHIEEYVRKRKRRLSLLMLIGSSKGPREWLEALHSWNGLLCKNDLLPSVDTSSVSKHGPQTPIKIAVLDTGVKLSYTLREGYDFRLRSYKSWMHADTPEWDLGAGSGNGNDGEDDDGHGTHSVSMVLCATKNSNCQVYAAKVFGKKNDIDHAETSRRIANVCNQSLFALINANCMIGYKTCRGHLESQHNIHVVWL